ncbi:MAG: type II toxin-antitoxin system YafQ family toxin [Candidatus Riflebacteria bacterium]|nr:type II toxin-antitoxin system YafQ family toxin [Candidatus Riflebacteria bacterium]
MKYSPQTSKQFEKDVKKLKKQGKKIEFLKEVMLILLNGDSLCTKYKDHELIGNWKGYRDCHIEVDLTIRFERTGSHSELFSK